jgi:hypothetical protein
MSVVVSMTIQAHTQVRATLPEKVHCCCPFHVWQTSQLGVGNSAACQQTPQATLCSISMKQAAMMLMVATASHHPTLLPHGTTRKRSKAAQALPGTVMIPALPPPSHPLPSHPAKSQQHCGLGCQTRSAASHPSKDRLALLDVDVRVSSPAGSRQAANHVMVQLPALFGTAHSHVMDQGFPNLVRLLWQTAQE